MPKKQKATAKETHDGRVRVAVDPDYFEIGYRGEMILTRDEAMLFAIDLAMASTGLGRGELAKHLAAME